MTSRQLSLWSYGAWAPTTSRAELGQESHTAAPCSLCGLAPGACRGLEGRASLMLLALEWGIFLGIVVSGYLPGGGGLAPVSSYLPWTVPSCWATRFPLSALLFSGPADLDPDPTARHRSCPGPGQALCQKMGSLGPGAGHLGML